jgi:hypothetical protein
MDHKYSQLCKVHIHVTANFKVYKRSCRINVQSRNLRLEWQFVTGGLGQTVRPIFKFQGVQDEKLFSDRLTLEDGTYRLSRNISNKLPFYAA